MSTEQRAFAAVDEHGVLVLSSISSNIELSKSLAGEIWRAGWTAAYLAGWRICPVIIRLEEQEQ